MQMYKQASPAFGVSILRIVYGTETTTLPPSSVCARSNLRYLMVVTIRFQLFVWQPVQR